MTYYTVIIKLSKNKDHFTKYRNVTNIDKLIDWLEKNHPDWQFLNMYSKNRELIKCIKKKEL